MKIGTIAKVLVFLFVILVVLSVISAVTDSMRQTYRAAQPPTQGQQPQPSAQTPAQPQPQIPAQAGLPTMIAPVTVVEKEALELQAGGGVLDVYNVSCDMSDVIPPAPVHSGFFSDADVSSIEFSRFSPATVFTQCRLLRLQFFYHIGAEGIYSFALTLRGGKRATAGSVRLNGIQVIPLISEEKTFAQTSLKEGWYKVDFRLYVNSKIYPYSSGYALHVKKPGSEMTTIAKDEMFIRKADFEKLSK